MYMYVTVSILGGCLPFPPTSQQKKETLVVDRKHMVMGLQSILWNYFALVILSSLTSPSFLPRGQIPDFYA